MMTKELVLSYFDKMDKCNGKPYLFRTRLERCLVKSKVFAEMNGNEQIHNEVVSIEKKLLYICDASNVTSTGNSRSFEILKDEIYNLKSLIKSA